ncbi:hypothetical protein D041_4240A, partial [Vibrio parahaemolyticus EKP-008]
MANGQFQSRALS